MSNMGRVSYPEVFRVALYLSYLSSNNFVLLRTAAESQPNQLPPTIRFQKWLQEDELEWQQIMSTPGELSSDAYIQVSENVYDLGENTHGILINCSASYPVQWVPVFKKGFDSKFGSFLVGINIYSVREYEDFDNMNSYRYSSQLLIASYYKELTANYSCQSVANSSLKSDIYLYVEGSTPEKLIHSGETIEILLDDKKFLEFPCSVSSPDVNVYLHKEVIQDGLVDFAEWVSVLPLDGITYNPITGFNVSADDPSFLLGRFRCITDEENDFVYIDIVSAPSETHEIRRPSTNIVLSPAKFEFDKENQRMMCCSNSNKPPKLIVHYCSTVQQCNIWDAVGQSEKNGRSKLMQEKMIKTNGSCSYIQFYFALNAKVICEGDGVNQNNQMIYSFIQGNKPRTPGQMISPGLEMHFLGESISLEKAVSVQLHGGTHSVNGFRSNPLYLKNGDIVEAFTKEKLIFSCRASPYFFAHMGVWSVQINENTKLVPKVQYPDISNYRDLALTLSLTANEMQSHARMTSITCHTPLWNSSAWVNTTINLKITESKMSKISSPNPSIVYWVINSTENNLICEAFGRPTPVIKWLRNGKDLNANPAHGKWNITHLNGTLTLKFLRITIDLHGQYVCQARNVAGFKEKSFIVIVEGSGSSLMYWILGITLLLSAVALGVMFWKARIHRGLLNSIRGSTEPVV